MQHKATRAPNGLVAALAAVLCIVPVVGRLTVTVKGASLRRTAPLDSKPSIARKNQLRSKPAKLVSEKRNTSSAIPTLPYRYTLYEPHDSHLVDRSLILLAPWNGTTGFFHDWLLNAFERDEPETRSHYRILEVVGRKMGEDEANAHAYNSWYEYEDWASETPVARDVDLAVEYVTSLIDQEYQIVGDYSRIVLAGFSQGANVALESALRFPYALGLVFSQRGVLLAARKEDTSEYVAATTYILTAGEDDPVYDVEQMKDNCKWLEEMHAWPYMKTISALGHYRKSDRECNLAIKSFAAMLASLPDSELQHLTDWTDCHQ